MIKKDNSENNDKEKELGCLDNTSHDNIWGWCVWFKKIENNDKKKELECLDDTSPDETEDEVCDKNI